MAEPALAHEPDYYYTDMPVGEILRRAREHYGQSVTDIERALRIRASQIEAIESGDLNRLPGRVYAVGFVRSYAEYLGLSGAKMVHLFKMQSVGMEEKPELNFLSPKAEGRVPPLWLALLSLMVAFGIMATWGMSHREDRTMVTAVPDVPAAIKEQMGPNLPPDAANALAPAAGTPAVAPVTTTVPAEPGIILNTKENSWVEITGADGKPIVSRVLKAGDQYFVPDRPDLKMSLGNAGGIEIMIDGETIAPLGKSGEIKRDIPLDSKALKAAN
jgi:cytoskeleton protein RodZ